MDIRPIRTESDYEWALAEIGAYFDQEPEQGTEEGDHFDVLSAAIGAYEDKQWPIEVADPLTTILETGGFCGFTRPNLAATQ